MQPSGCYIGPTRQVDAISEPSEHHRTFIPRCIGEHGQDALEDIRRLGRLTGKEQALATVTFSDIPRIWALFRYVARPGSFFPTPSSHGVPRSTPGFNGSASFCSPIFQVLTENSTNPSQHIAKG
jgi:hypothetical protein